MDYRRRLYPNRLRKFRMRAGYQQKHVAKLLGINSTVSIWEWEEALKFPHGKSLIKLCIIYDAQLHELYPEYYNLMRSEMYEGYSE